MSNEELITHEFHDGRLQVPKDALFRAYLEKVLGTPSPTPRDIPLIGAEWKGQGGINAGLGRDEAGNPYWLIAAPPDLCVFEATWGGYGEEEPGAVSEFDGLADTIALCESKIEHPAAERCRVFVHEGHKDYYLGSKREMAQVRASIGELIRKGWFLTSSQYSANHAWYQVFDDGGQYANNKYGTGFVLPVRRLRYSLI